MSLIHIFLYYFLLGNNLDLRLHDKISDISFLDVSRPEEYVWTNVFTPQPPHTLPPQPSKNFGSVRSIEYNGVLFSLVVVYVFVSFI